MPRSRALREHAAAQAEPEDGFYTQIWALRAQQGRMCPRLGNLDIFNFFHRALSQMDEAQLRGLLGKGTSVLPLVELRKLGAEQDTGLIEGCSPPCPPVPFLPLLHFC